MIRSRFTRKHLESASNVGAIANASPSAAAPTKAEFDAVVAKLNSALQVLRDAGLIPPA